MSAPAAANSGFADGDYLYLGTFDCTGQKANVDALIARGVTLTPAPGCE